MKNDEKPFVYLGKNLIEKLNTLELDFYSTDLKDWSFIYQLTENSVTIISRGGELKEYEITGELDKIIPIDLGKNFKQLFSKIFPSRELIKLIVVWNEFSPSGEPVPLICGEEKRFYYIYKVSLQEQELEQLKNYTYPAAFFIYPKYLKKHIIDKYYNVEDEGKNKVYIISNKLQHSVVIDIPNDEEQYEFNNKTK